MCLTTTYWVWFVEHGDRTMQQTVTTLLKKEELPISTIQWSNLIFDMKVDEVLILQLLYSPQPKPMTLKEIDRRVRKLNLCSKTVRRKISKLEEIGLIKTVNSYGLFVYPIPDLINNVAELINQCKKRFNI